MVIQPPWRLPHSFERLKAGIPVTETLYATTYGLVVTELCRADSLIDERLLDRVGLPWLIDLDDQISTRSSLQLTLDELGIGGPGQMSSERLWPHDDGDDGDDGDDAAQVPDPSLWASLAASAGLRVREFIENELAVFAHDLEGSAPGGQPSASLQPAVQRLLDIHPVRFRVRRFHDRATGWKKMWGLQYDRLLERVLLELQWLYVDRPKLRRCVLCDAVYITNERRANCFWTVWNTRGDEVQRCSSPAVFQDFAQRETELTHQRTRKRLNEAHRRALVAAGGDKNDKRVKEAQRSRQAYMKNHRRRRGPTATIDVGGPGVVRDDWRS